MAKVSFDWTQADQHGSPEKALIDLVKFHESFRAHKYKDVGHDAIGYGSRWTGGSTTITEPEATKLLHRDLKNAEKYILDNHVFTDQALERMPKAVYGAMISMFQNMKDGAKLAKSTLVGMLNADTPPDLHDVKKEMQKWHKVGGVPSAGIFKRAYNLGKIIEVNEDFGKFKSADVGEPGLEKALSEAGFNRGHKSKHASRQDGHQAEQNHPQPHKRGNRRHHHNALRHEHGHSTEKHDHHPHKHTRHVSEQHDGRREQQRHFSHRL